MSDSSSPNTSEVKSVIDAAVVEELAKYLAGRESLAQFARRFSRVERRLAGEDADKNPIAHRVSLRLAEWVRGHRTESELHREFSLLSGRAPVAPRSAVVTDLKIRISSATLEPPRYDVEVGDSVRRTAHPVTV